MGPGSLHRHEGSSVSVSLNSGQRSRKAIRPGFSFIANMDLFPNL